jgi:hypothetical protein
MHIYVYDFLSHYSSNNDLIPLMLAHENDDQIDVCNACSQKMLVSEAEKL